MLEDVLDHYELDRTGVESRHSSMAKRLHDEMEYSMEFEISQGDKFPLRISSDVIQLSWMHLDRNSTCTRIS